jgi:hypothetical protein
MTRSTSASDLSLSEAIAAYLDWHALRGSTSRHRKEIRRMLQFV